MLLIVAASRDTRYLELSCAELYIFGLRPGIAWFHPDVLHACNHGLITIGVMHARLINIDHPHEPSATATATRLRLRNVFNRVGVICTACVSLDEYTFAPGVISRDTWARGHPSLRRRSAPRHGRVSGFVFIHKTRWISPLHGRNCFV